MIVQNLRGASVFYRNKRDLSPEGEKLLRCFSAITAVAESGRVTILRVDPMSSCIPGKKTSCVT